MALPESLSFWNDSLPLLAAAVFALAGLVKGVVGLGLPTLSMALLALVMAPAQAAALLIVPSLVTNVWQLRPWESLGPIFRRLAPMQWGVCFGTLAGAWALGAPAGAWAVVGLGAALIGYAAWGLAGARIWVRPQTEKWLGPLIGAVTGLVTAATGVFVIPAVPYLQALCLQRDELIQAMGISFTVSTLALAVGLYFNDRYPGATFGASVLMLLPALAGMAAGHYLRQKLSPVLFRQCFLGSLILLGIHMIASAVR
ncbi:MAG: putative rane protein [Polaromonas sp.]|nr:putative rane protein [Polaromonas sp.]